MRSLLKHVLLGKMYLLKAHVFLERACNILPTFLGEHVCRHACAGEAIRKISSRRSKSKILELLDKNSFFLLHLHYFFGFIVLFLP